MFLLLISNTFHIIFSFFISKLETDYTSSDCSQIKYVFTNYYSVMLSRRWSYYLGVLQRMIFY